MMEQILVLAGALLEHAEELLRIGLSVSEVIEGYEEVLKTALEILPDLVCCSAKNLWDVEEGGVFAANFNNE